MIVLAKISSGRAEEATLAQLVEQLIRNQQVVGSNPTGGSNKIKGLELNQRATSSGSRSVNCRRVVFSFAFFSAGPVDCAPATQTRLCDLLCT